MADRAAMPTDRTGTQDTDPDDTASDATAATPETTSGAAVGAQTGTDREPRIAAGPGEGLPTHVPRSVRSLLWQARVGTGLAILFGLLALVLFLQSQGLRSAAAAQEQALEAGRGIALQITTYEGAAIDAWIDQTQQLATPSFAEEVATLFDPELRQGLAANQVTSAGEITSSFVQALDGDAATVFVVMRQTYSSAALPREVSDQLRMEVELQRVDGEWLADNVVALGPSTISPVGGEDPAAQDPAAQDPAAPDAAPEGEGS